MISDFSKQIKEGTKKSHSMAENTSFVASFLRGVICLLYTSDAADE